MAPELLPLKWLFNWLWDWLAGWLLLNWLWEWWTAERVVALATAGQLVVLVAAALYARAQVREARELREDQARPFVVVDFEVSRPPEIRLAIANIGKTMARDVRVSFAPPLQSSMDRPERRLADLRMLNEPIPAMAPGKIYSTLFDVGLHDGLPDRYMVPSPIGVTVVGSTRPTGSRWTLACTATLTSSCRGPPRISTRSSTGSLTRCSVGRPRAVGGYWRCPLRT